MPWIKVNPRPKCADGCLKRPLATASVGIGHWEGSVWQCPDCEKKHTLVFGPQYGEAVWGWN